MKKRQLLSGIIQRGAGYGYGSLRYLTVRSTSRALATYADWRVGALETEKRAHKTSDSILLTFDDYGTKEQVEAILRTLARYQVKAMFFVQGDWAAREPELVERLASGGHIVANHTYSHQDMLGLADAQLREEIERGVPGPWLRPPRGRYNARIRRLASELGRSIVYWSIDSDDWQGVQAEAMSRKILAQLHPGAVILFHLHAAHTSELLPGLITDIRRRGFELCTFDETWDSPA